MEIHEKRRRYLHGGVQKKQKTWRWAIHLGKRMQIFWKFLRRFKVSIALFRHGQGRVNYPDGRQIKGYWEMGKLVEVDKKFKQEEQESQMDEPLAKPGIKVIESPSKELQASKHIQKV